MNLRRTFLATVSCCRCGTTCCLVSFIVSLIVSFFALLALFLKTPASELEFTVAAASLTQFDFAAAKGNLSYALALNISVRNPNRKGGLIFESFHVSTSYRGRFFALAASDNSTMPFYLGRNKAAVVTVAIRGRAFVLMEESDVEGYDSERISGVYSVDAKLNLRLRNVTFDHKTKSYLEPPMINCDKLRIPYKPHGLSPSGLDFKAARCTNVYIFTSPNKTTFFWP